MSRMIKTIPTINGWNTEKSLAKLNKIVVIQPSVIATNDYCWWNYQIV